jgi:hypothetical protein
LNINQFSQEGALKMIVAALTSAVGLLLSTPGRADICDAGRCMKGTYTDSGFDIANTCSDTIVIHVLYTVDGSQQVTAPPQWNSRVAPGMRRRMSCPIVGCSEREFWVGATFDNEGVSPRSGQALARMRQMDQKGCLYTGGD